MQDIQDGYQFLYPFGWQEITVKGTDVAYKDVVEPLETVAVTLTPTDRQDITDYGDITQVGNGEVDVCHRSVMGAGFNWDPLLMSLLDHFKRSYVHVA